MIAHGHDRTLPPVCIQKFCDSTIYRTQNSQNLYPSKHFAHKLKQQPDEK